MSTSHEHYLILGVDIKDLKPDDDYERDQFYENLAPLRKGKHPLFCLYDGMNGEYVLIGKILAKGTEYDGLSLHSFSVETLEKTKEEVQLLIQQEFQIEKEPQLYAVTHWR